MNKSLKIFLGICSIFPLATNILLEVTDNIIQLPIENELIGYLYTNIFFYSVVLTVILLIGFIVYTYASNVVPKDKKHLWASVLFLGHIIAFPFFWFNYIWKITSESHS